MRAASIQRRFAYRPKRTGFLGVDDVADCFENGDIGVTVASDSLSWSGRDKRREEHP